MNILVTGGSGYIGSVLVPYLIEKGHVVDVIDLCWFGNHLPENVTVLKKDVINCSEKDLKGYDSVINLAGLSNDPMAEYNPKLNFIINGAMPTHLAFTAKKAGVKQIIISSTCSVYGNTASKTVDERSITKCEYPYGVSKLQAEKGVLQLCDNNFSAIILRQGTISGSSPRMRFDLLVNTMFKTAMAENRIIISNPEIRRPVCHMADICKAYANALKADRSTSGVFNIVSSNNTLLQVGETVKNEIEKLTGKRINMEIKNIQDNRNYCADITRAKNDLGFKPEHDIKDIIKDLYNSRDKYPDFDNEYYYNIKIFKQIEKDYLSNLMIQ